jgi:hypothetical protein
MLPVLTSANYNKNLYYLTSFLINSILPRTQVTHPISIRIENSDSDSKSAEDVSILLTSANIVNPEKVRCPTCGEIDYPYYINRHKHETEKGEREK